MQPRANYWPSTYRIVQRPNTSTLYASLKHPSDENRDATATNRLESNDSPPREHYHRHCSTPDEHDLDDLCDNRVSYGNYTVI